MGRDPPEPDDPEVPAPPVEPDVPPVALEPAAPPVTLDPAAPPVVTVPPAPPLPEAPPLVELPPLEVGAPPVDDPDEPPAPPLLGAPPLDVEPPCDPPLPVCTPPVPVDPPAVIVDPPVGAAPAEIAESDLSSLAGSTPVAHPANDAHAAPASTNASDFTFVWGTASIHNYRSVPGFAQRRTRGYLASTTRNKDIVVHQSSLTSTIPCNRDRMSHDRPSCRR
jgi:hypothetical protein